MVRLTQFFATRGGIIGVGAFIGVFAALLQRWGNPVNMGVGLLACLFIGVTMREKVA